MNKEPRLAVKISKSLYKDLVRLAKMDGKKINYLMDRAVLNFLKSSLYNRLNTKKDSNVHNSGRAK